MKLFSDLSLLSAQERAQFSQENYLEWKACPLLSAQEKDSLDALCQPQERKEQVFLSLLSFGTAGIRGKMHLGAGGINRFTVAVATMALAYAVKQTPNGAQKGVVIACDSRNHSQEFAQITACVLAREGVKVYLFESLRPTPELSFAILHLGCRAGVNITASHNTKEYNGYKAYWDNGAQIGPAQAGVIAKKCYDFDLLGALEGCDYSSFVQQGKIEIIGREVDEAFLEKVLSTGIMPAPAKEIAQQLKIVYTPLHGAGHALVPELLRRDGFACVSTVAEQMVLDGDFPTVTKPNPQDRGAFDMGIALAREIGSELIVATDPDADRAGVAIRESSGEFTVLTGNQIGCLLLEFIIEALKRNNAMPDNGAVVMSLVSSALADAICRENGVTLFKVYTGFKYIGEKIAEFEATGAYTYLFGFEESHGYLRGTYSRDKDALGGVMLICEMAAYYKSLGLTLSDALAALYNKYGFVSDFTYEMNITDADFLTKMKHIVEGFRTDPFASLDGEEVVTVNDYLSQTTRSVATGVISPLPLEKENMVSFVTAGFTSLVVRPSGTEPKIKFYVSLRAADAVQAKEKYQRIVDQICSRS